MSNAQLAIKNSEPQRRTAAWDCMRKLRDSSELAESTRRRATNPDQPIVRDDYPVLYETLTLELLFDEANALLRKMATSSLPSAASR